MTRLSVNISEETAAALREGAERDGSITEVVRRAVTVYQFLDHAQRDGQRIQITDGASTTLVILL